MKKQLPILVFLLCQYFHLFAQIEPTAGNWKLWFISAVKAYRLPPPPPAAKELGQVLSAQQNLDSTARQQILFWNAGAPGYRWQEMMNKLWTVDTSNNGVLANMLLGAGIYDATLAAWDTKYAYQRKRPFEIDPKIKAFVVKPDSPSYPCEHSVAAGVAVAVISHFYPLLADSVAHMAQRLMASRIAVGTAFPSDTRAGYELGKHIAEKEIEMTQGFIPRMAWDGKRPDKPGIWNGKNPMFVLGGKSKTVVLDSASQFRPAPPPDFARDMAELKAYKQTFRSKANAFYFASQNFGGEMLNQKLFEYNLQANPPRAARAYAATAIAAYDCFVACWDAKYAYWGIRPDQYDTTYHPLVPTPPFPGYPSGHAVMCGMMETLYSYLFPADKVYFSRRAKEGAESRFQAGIHFRTDNEVGLDLGRKVTAKVVERLIADSADNEFPLNEQSKVAVRKQ